MTEIWLDTYLSPTLAAWIHRNDGKIDAQPVRAVGRQDAQDEDTFQATRQAGGFVASKDSDVLNRLNRYGPRPKVI